MKKALLIIAVIVLAMIALSSIGPILGMAISLAIVYVSVKQFLASRSVMAKVIWSIVGFFGLSGLVASLPALAGIAAVYILYTVYRNWKTEAPLDSENEEDPFSNFERQWKELEKQKG